jgi:hypothetical protein
MNRVNTIYNSHSLVFGDLDLIAAQVTIRSSSHELGALLLIHAEFLECSDDVSFACQNLFVTGTNRGKEEVGKV